MKANLINVMRRKAEVSSKVADLVRQKQRNKSNPNLRPDQVKHYNKVINAKISAILWVIGELDDL